MHPQAGGVERRNFALPVMSAPVQTTLHRVCTFTAGAWAHLHAADAGGVVGQSTAGRRGAGLHGGQNRAPPLPRLPQRLLHDLQRDALHLRMVVMDIED